MSNFPIFMNTLPSIYQYTYCNMNTNYKYKYLSICINLYWNGVTNISIIQGLVPAVRMSCLFLINSNGILISSNIITVVKWIKKLNCVTCHKWNRSRWVSNKYISLNRVILDFVWENRKLWNRKELKLHIWKYSLTYLKDVFIGTTKWHLWNIRDNTWYMYWVRSVPINKTNCS